jgi:hypothetical protein
MNRPDDKEAQAKAAPKSKPSRLEEARRVVERYVDDLREIIRKLKGKLNLRLSGGTKPCLPVDAGRPSFVPAPKNYAAGLEIHCPGGAYFAGLKSQYAPLSGPNVKAA